LFISSMCFFLIHNTRISYSNGLAILFLFLFIILWLIKPSIFKNVASLYINLFITYYIVSQDGFKVMKRQLTYLVAISAIFSIIQISGITPIVHLLNSQYLVDKAGVSVRHVEVKNILWNDFGQNYIYDSRQVRAPGIFHSSALVSGVYVMYIAFIFCGYFRSLISFAFIPFLIAFSGSKLVLLTAIIFLIIALIFKRITLRLITILIISSFLSITFHRLLFHSLLDFQFNFKILYYSINTRIKQYNWESIDFVSYLPYLLMVVVLIAVIYFIKKRFLIIPNYDKIFHYIILSIALISSFFATPHIANLLFGWFYIPAFFFFRYANINRNTKKTVLNEYNISPVNIFDN
jgi:hypothetical protein